MTSLSIGELARRTGLRTSALRYYEEQGVLPAASRVNGRRCYDAEMMRMVEVLRFAQQAGFTLEEIKTLFRGFERGPTLSARWRSLATAKLAELDALVERAARMRRAIELGLQCGCMRLEDCMLSAANGTAKGIDATATAAPKDLTMIVIKTMSLFVVTAIAEIVGCYLPYLWLNKDGSPWLLLPAAGSLALFAWLLALHPAASGRIYAAYGGVYVAVALLWFWRVDGVSPTPWDLTGVVVTLVGMAIIVWGGWQT